MKEQLPRHQIWQEPMEAWEESGLTQKEYCKRNELKLATFGLWRKRLPTPPKKACLLSMPV